MITEMSHAGPTSSSGQMSDTESISGDRHTQSMAAFSPSGFGFPENQCRQSQQVSSKKPFLPKQAFVSPPPKL
jgi:hypothetical protein